MNLSTGHTYDFNNAVAQVMAITEIEVLWYDQRAPKTCRRTPRWYFEKYAALSSERVARAQPEKR